MREDQVSMEKRRSQPCPSLIMRQYDLWSRTGKEARLLAAAAIQPFLELEKDLQVFMHRQAQ